MIYISDFERIADAYISVEVGETIPLRVRTYENPVGVKYLRVGDFSDSLFEILLSPDSFAIRGFSLVSRDTTHEPRKLLADLACVAGVPIVDVGKTGAFKGSMYAPRIDLVEPFSVGMGKDFAEIRLFDWGTEPQCFVHRNLRFIVQGDMLAAVRIEGLTQMDLAKLNLKPPGWLR